MNGNIPFLYYERKVSNRRYKEYLRDTMDPFNIDDRCFIETYRLPKHLVMKLIDEIKPFINDANNSLRIPLYMEVLATLNFYASGIHQRRSSLDSLALMSQSKISRSISRVSKVIGTNLVQKYIVFPTNLAAAHIKKEEFLSEYGIPGIVGLIDCSHIAITNLRKTDEQAYANSKGFHSINTQAICDVDMRILNVNARYPGATHDSQIWEGSIIVPVLEQLNLEDNKTWLFGDSNYILEPCMMVPYSKPTTKAQQEYNTVHAKIRSGIERCFEILKSRFKCLKTSTGPLYYDHQKAALIIHSCAVLHNLLIDNNYPIEYDDNEDSDEIVPVADVDEEDDSGEVNREFLTNFIQENDVII